MKKVRLYPIDKDYLKLIQKTNYNGQLFIPRVLGTAGYNSLDRLEAAGKIEYVKGKYVGGYKAIGKEVG